jgi:hypothetical protein
MTEMKFSPGAADDAARDALALVRAALHGDRAAAAVVAANMSWPPVTAVVLAEWLASLTTGDGLSPDDALAALSAWQDGAGLG